MAKRNEKYKSYQDVTKQLLKENRRNKASQLPSGFSFSVIDGELYIKRYTDGATQIANINSALTWSALDNEEVNEQL